MLLYDIFTCKLCKETYKGLFNYSNNLGIVCQDCEAKVKHPPVLFSTKQNPELEQYMVLDFLEKDIVLLYPSVHTQENSRLDLFLNDSGEIDSYKIYFQGNDLDFCIDAREIAYLCLDYLDTNDLELIGFSEQLINEYLELRFKKLNKKELQMFKDKLNSSEVNRIKIFLGG